MTCRYSVQSEICCRSTLPSDVATLPGHRQRGYARAAVARATREAAPRHGLVFLTAVDGRWVKRWYERRGFEQIGLRYEATRSA